MQSKSSKNESAKKVQDEDNAHNSEMKEALNIQINENMNIDSFETKARLALEDFIEDHAFYQNLKILGYDIAYCHYNIIAFKEDKRYVDVYFNLVWGNIEDKDFHRQELKETLNF